MQINAKHLFCVITLRFDTECEFFFLYKTFVTTKALIIDRIILIIIKTTPSMITAGPGIVQLLVRAV
jgi:hypothetical protein